MSKFIEQKVDSCLGEVVATMDEVSDTYEEACDYSQVCASDHSAGAEILRLRREPFEDPDDVDFVVVEIDE